MNQVTTAMNASNGRLQWASLGITGLLGTCHLWGGITRADVKMITVYIRELQLANGIN
jgi:hypothetical protein